MKMGTENGVLGQQAKKTPRIAGRLLKLRQRLGTDFSSEPWMGASSVNTLILDLKTPEQ